MDTGVTGPQSPATFKEDDRYTGISRLCLVHGGFESLRRHLEQSCLCSPKPRRLKQTGLDVVKLVWLQYASFPEAPALYVERRFWLSDRKALPQGLGLLGLRVSHGLQQERDGEPRLLRSNQGHFNLLVVPCSSEPNALYYKMDPWIRLVELFH